MRDRLVRQVRARMRQLGLTSDRQLAAALGDADKKKGQVSTFMSDGRCGLDLFFDLVTVLQLDPTTAVLGKPPDDVPGFLEGREDGTRAPKQRAASPPNPGGAATHRRARVKAS